LPAPARAAGARSIDVPGLSKTAAIGPPCALPRVPPKVGLPKQSGCSASSAGTRLHAPYLPFVISVGIGLVGWEAVIRSHTIGLAEVCPNVAFHCGEAKKCPVKMSVRDWAAPFHCRNTASLSVGCSICRSMGAMPSTLPHFLRWCAVTQCHGLCIRQDRASRSSESGSLDLGSAETR
jgi:hypothetical protein